LADAGGNLFGVGASGNGTFFVIIQQGTSSTSPDELVSLSTTRVHAGSDVTVYVKGFPANSEIDYRVGKLGEDSNLIYDGTVGSDGTTQKTITIPADAVNGEYWVVEVLTTSLRDVMTVTSHSIYIADISTPPYTSDLQVSLSTTQAKAGDALTVYVRGFPANSEIDFRIGKQGESYNVVYDGTVALNGSTIQLITIPASAVNGDYWVVQVTTTNLHDPVTLTSHTIYITH
jgi:protein involved in polysaccharide export with SLBB domain